MVLKRAMHHQLYSCLFCPCPLLPSRQLFLPVSVPAPPCLFHFLHSCFDCGLDFWSGYHQNFDFCFDSRFSVSFFSTSQYLFPCDLDDCLSCRIFPCSVLATKTLTNDCCKMISMSDCCKKTMKTIEILRRRRTYCDYRYYYCCCHCYRRVIWISVSSTDHVFSSVCSSLLFDAPFLRVSFGVQAFVALFRPAFALSSSFQA